MQIELASAHSDAIEAVWSLPAGLARIAAADSRLAGFGRGGGGLSG